MERKYCAIVTLDAAFIYISVIDNEFVLCHEFEFNRYENDIEIDPAEALETKFTYDYTLLYV